MASLILVLLRLVEGLGGLTDSCLAEAGRRTDGLTDSCLAEAGRRWPH